MDRNLGGIVCRCEVQVGRGKSPDFQDAADSKQCEREESIVVLKVGDDDRLRRNSLNPNTSLATQ